MRLTLVILLCAFVSGRLVSGSDHEPAPPTAKDHEAGAKPPAVLTPNPEPAPSAATEASPEPQEKLASEPFEHNTNPDDPVAGRSKKFLEDQKFKTKFDLAKKLRVQKNDAAADKILWDLTENPTPLERQKEAFLELANVAKEARQFTKAQRVLSQYVRKFVRDPSVPQILLRQGLLYRDMAMPELAIAKFFSVASMSLSLNLDKLDYYRDLVLTAQTEIAETYYLQGKYDEALAYYRKLLRLDEVPDSKRAAFSYKVIRCLASKENSAAETFAEAQYFLKSFTDSVDVPEVRFVAAKAAKELGRIDDALREVFELLRSQRSTANPEVWAHWQQRAGNEIANQFYKEGSYGNAREIYQQLARLNPAPAWQLPVLYQIGLTNERDDSPANAITNYLQIISRKAELLTNSPTPALLALVDMAQWRKDYLTWHTNISTTERFLQLPKPLKPEAADDPKAPAQSSPGPSAPPLEKIETSLPPNPKSP